MDAEHRHELKRNDFIEYAKQAPDYLKKRWWEVLCVVVILVAVYMMFSDRKPALPTMEKQAKVTAVYEDIAEAKAALINEGGSDEKIEELVRDLLSKAAKLDGSQKSLALIKAGDAIRAKLHYSDKMPAADAVEAAVSEAVTLYEQAAKEAEKDVQIQAMASYAIALARQDGGNFDEAANIYGQILANAEYDKTPFAALAKEKLATIAMAKQQFNFVEAPAPAAEPAPQAQQTPAVQ